MNPVYSPTITSKQQDNFWKKVVKTDGCWGWNGAINTGGYAKVSINGRCIGGHRVSWIVHFGQIPDGYCVLHKCDNRKCTNPEHLFLGTKDDNNKDKVKKGRQQTGESHTKSKLTQKEVDEIRRLYQPGVYGCGRVALAKKFNVHPSTIRQIVLYESWNTNKGG